MLRSRFPTLIWDNVPEQMTPAARVWLRNCLVPLAQRVFDRTSQRFWLEWLSDTSLNKLKRFVLVFDNAGQPIGWAAAGAFEVGGRRCFYGSSAGVDPVCCFSVADLQSAILAHNARCHGLTTAILTMLKDRGASCYAAQTGSFCSAPAK